MPCLRIPRAFPSFVRWTLVLACFAVALFGCASCSTVKPMGGAAVGAGAGLLVAGPAGGAIGAAAGAGAGALWQVTADAEKERDDVLASLKHEQAENIELRATLKANAQIDAYNAGTLHKVPHTTPVDPDESHWYSRLWLWLVGLAGVSLGYVFRATLWAWTKRLAIWLVGLLALTRSASPTPLEPPPLDPAHPSDP